MQTHVTICPFPNIGPINTVKEGIKLGHYTDHYRHITDKTVPLKPAQGVKSLHLVCFNKTVEKTEHAINLLCAEGKQLCRNAPNYLLGLMAQVREDKIPLELHNKDIVAAELDNTSLLPVFFFDGLGGRCFLCVNRSGVHRKLDLVGVVEPRFSRCAFLAEDLVP